MKTELLFKKMMRRDNILISAIGGAALHICSYPRLFIEVFIRREFGRRHFTLASALTVFILMLTLPVIFKTLMSASRYGGETSLADFWFWYLITFAFLGASIIRYREIRRRGPGYDLDMFTLYSGHIHSFFKTLKFKGKPLTERMIEIVVEPGLVFVIGLLLYLLGKGTGTWLMLCAVLYSLSYVGAYKIGDDYLMDAGDVIIINKQKERVFVQGANPRDAQGVQFYMTRPLSEEHRRELAKEMFDDDECATAL